jgi:hypothetical protein
MKYLTTKNTFSVGTKIDEEKIMEAKLYLKNYYNNKYDANPHFNFLITAMPDYRLKDLESLTENYFKNKKSVKIKLGKLHYEQKGRFFSISILGKEVIQLHKELIDVLNPIRDGYIREKDLTRIKENKTSEEEKENILTYGYLHVLNTFKPHITVGNIQSEGDVDIRKIKSNLDSILDSVYNKELLVKNILVSYIQDAEVQSDYKKLWEKVYKLK